MIDYMLNIYEEEIYNCLKRKVKEFTKKEKVILAILFVLGIWVISLIMLSKNGILLIIAILIYAVIGLVGFMLLIKDNKMRARESLSEYYKKLDKIRMLLKEDKFDLYDGVCITEIIKNLNEKLDKPKILDRTFKPIFRSAFTLISPIIAFILGIISEITANEVLFEYANLVLIISVGFLGLGLMFYPRFEYVINRRNYIMSSFRKELQDIFILDFLK